MRRPGWLVAVPLALAVATVGTGGGAYAVRTGEALPGTTVAGIDVGGLGAADLRRRLAPVVAERNSCTVTMTVGQQRFRATPAEAGTAVDLATTTNRALRAGRDGPLWADIWAAVSAPWASRQVPLAVDDRPSRRRDFVAAVAASVDRPPQPGRVSVDPDGGSVATTSSVPGRRVDRQATATLLRAGARRPGSMTAALPVQPIAPQVTDAELTALAGRIRAALAGPLILTGGGVAISLSAAELAPLLGSTVVDDGSGGRTVQLAVDTAGLRRLVEQRAAEVETSARSARLAVEPAVGAIDEQGDVTVSPLPADVRLTAPSVPGRDVDIDVAVRTVTEALQRGQRAGSLPVEVTPPPVSTEQARSVDSRLSVFTTYHACCQPRVRNIARIAEIVDGAVIPPGGEFSLNGYVGRRTTDKGFVPAPTIIDRELVDTVGGGISQFATTLFNAAFFAGLPIEDYQPHSRYISRYPVGREATVNYPNVDLVLANDTGSPLLIAARTTDTSVTVGLYGADTGRTVRAVTGAREPLGGEGDFRIRVTRVVSGPEGEDRRVFTTYYERPDADTAPDE